MNYIRNLMGRTSSSHEVGSSSSASSSSRGPHPFPAQLTGFDIRGGAAGTSQSTSLSVPEAPGPAQQATIHMQAMGRLSSPYDSVGFFKKKPRAEQYQYAQRLTAEQRDQLEMVLEQALHSAEAPEQALTMWLSVQHVRLQIKGQGARPCREHSEVTQPLVVQSALDQYHRASAKRPEYKKAFDNFMRLMGDSSLTPSMYDHLANALEYHWLTENLIEHQESRCLSGLGMAYLVRIKYRALDFEFSRLTNNLMRPAFVEETAYEQSTPVGYQIKKWLEAAKQPPLENARIFDNELYSGLFGRALERFRIESVDACKRSEMSLIFSQGARIIHAIATEPELRAMIFATAETALGSCRDNIKEGFSKFITILNTYEITKGVASGKLKQRDLHRWALQQFRLQVLETELMRMINELLQNPAISNSDRITLTNEPLGVFQYVKSKLKDILDLPAEMVSSVYYDDMLKRRDINFLQMIVCEQEKNLNVVEAFLLKNEAWRAGMMRIHSKKLSKIEKKFESHPWFEEKLPSSDDVAAASEYAEKGDILYKRKIDTINQALIKLNYNPHASIENIVAAMFEA